MHAPGDCAFPIPVQCVLPVSMVCVSAPLVSIYNLLTSSICFRNSPGNPSNIHPASSAVRTPRYWCAHTHTMWGKREMRDINTMHKHGILPTEHCGLWHIQSNTDFHQLSYIGILFLTFSLHNPVNHKKLIISSFIKSYISKSKFA